MNFIVVGLNHESAPVGLRERLALAAAEVPNLLESLRARAGLEEAALLSTCNRVEIYARGAGSEPRVETVAEAFAALRGVPPGDFTPHLYSHSGREAVRHLCRVSCGIDSMVIGETDILGQVREAFLCAESCGSAGNFFNNLSQMVFHTAKTVHTQTGISKEKISVGSVAVDLAARFFAGLADRCVLVIGAGGMGKSALAHLAERDVGSIVLANRTFESARELAEKYGAEPVHIDEVLACLEKADIVIAASAAPHLIVRPERVREAMRRRPDRPLFLIDIAVPRDIDPEVAGIEGVQLYDIDSLRLIVEENTGARREEVERCRSIIDERVARFGQRWRGEEARLIERLTGRVEEIRREETEKLLRRLEEISPEQKEMIEQMCRRLANRILHTPLSRIGSVAEGERGALLEAARKLFDIE